MAVNTVSKWERCPICSTPMEIWRDTMYGSECERTEDCQKGCGLYHYQHAYGSFREVHGFIEQEWSHTESDRDRTFRDDYQKFAKAETRKMWNNPELQPLLRMWVAVGCDLRPLRDRITELELDGKLLFTVREIDRLIAEEVARAA